MPGGRGRRSSSAPTVCPARHLFQQCISVSLWQVYRWFGGEGRAGYGRVAGHWRGDGAAVSGGRRPGGLQLPSRRGSGRRRWRPSAAGGRLPGDPAGAEHAGGWTGAGGGGRRGLWTAGLLVVNHGIWPAEDMPISRMAEAQWRRTMGSIWTRCLGLCRPRWRRWNGKLRGGRGEGPYCADQLDCGAAGRGVSRRLCRDQRRAD